MAFQGKWNACLRHAELSHGHWLRCIVGNHPGIDLFTLWDFYRFHVQSLILIDPIKLVAISPLTNQHKLSEPSRPRCRLTAANANILSWSFFNEKPKGFSIKTYLNPFIVTLRADLIGESFTLLRADANVPCIKWYASLIFKAIAVDIFMFLAFRFCDCCTHQNICEMVWFVGRFAFFGKFSEFFHVFNLQKVKR